MNKNEALQRCMKICSTKEYAPSDINEKLTNWGISGEDSEIIINELIEEKFLNTSRFTQFYVNDKIRFNKWGKIKISLMLKQKGIQKELIKEALENFNEEEYFTILKNEIVKKNKALKIKDEYTRNGKLFQFAASRGFESDVTKKVLKSLNFKTIDSDF